MLGYSDLLQKKRFIFPMVFKSTFPFLLYSDGVENKTTSHPFNIKKVTHLHIFHINQWLKTYVYRVPVALDYIHSTLHYSFLASVRAVQSDAYKSGPGFISKN